METTTTAPRIYVACLASYNAGVLHGRWIEATTDVNAMQAEIAAMLLDSKFPNVTVQCPDCMGTGESFPGVNCKRCKATGNAPSAEEWAIHDSEGLGNIGEYAGLDEVARRVAIVEAAEERDIPAAVLIEAMRDLAGEDDDPESFVSDYYDGSAESWLDFTSRAGDCFDVDALPEWVRNYVDWESMARDWELGGDWSAYRAGDFGELYFFRTR